MNHWWTLFCDDCILYLKLGYNFNNVWTPHVLQTILGMLMNCQPNMLQLWGSYWAYFCVQRRQFKDIFLAAGFQLLLQWLWFFFGGGAALGMQSLRFPKRGHRQTKFCKAQTRMRSRKDFNKFRIHTEHFGNIRGVKPNPNMLLLTFVRKGSNFGGI